MHFNIPARKLTLTLPYLLPQLEQSRKFSGHPSVAPEKVEEVDPDQQQQQPGHEPRRIWRQNGAHLQSLEKRL